MYVWFHHVRGNVPSMGYVLANTSALVVSAPMAWFIMQKGSHFMFSNDFGYIGLDAILGQMMHSQLDVKDNSTFLVNKVNDYIFRPKELKNVNLWHDLMSNTSPKRMEWMP